MDKTTKDFFWDVTQAQGKLGHALQKTHLAMMAILATMQDSPEKNEAAENLSQAVEFLSEHALHFGTILARLE